MDKKLLEEFKQIMNSERNSDIDAISLYDVLKLVVSKNSEFKCKESQFESAIYQNWEYYSSVRTSPIYIEFDYKNNELKFEIVGYFSDKFSYKKYFDDLRLTKHSHEGKRILEESSDIISMYYDECLKYSDFNTQSSERIKAVNSNFLVDINNKGATIYLENLTFTMKYKIHHWFPNEYDYNFDFGMFHGNENEIFKRIFVKIEDCPKWTHILLKEVRKKQLTKEKKLKLVKNIFPFMK